MFQDVPSIAEYSILKVAKYCDCLMLPHVASSWAGGKDSQGQDGISDFNYSSVAAHLWKADPCRGKTSESCPGHVSNYQIYYLRHNHALHPHSSTCHKPWQTSPFKEFNSHSLVLACWWGTSSWADHAPTIPWCTWHINVQRDCHLSRSLKDMAFVFLTRLNSYQWEMYIQKGLRDVHTEGF